MAEREWEKNLAYGNYFFPLVKNRYQERLKRMDEKLVIKGKELRWERSV